MAMDDAGVIARLNDHLVEKSQARFTPSWLARTSI